MPRTTIAPYTPLGPFVTGQPTALSLDPPFTAADVSNKNQLAFSGGTKILVWRNSHASTGYTVTLTSKADSRGRSQDVTTYAVAAGVTGCFRFDNAEGWQQADTYIYFEANNASVLFAVLTV